MCVSHPSGGGGGRRLGGLLLADPLLGRSLHLGLWLWSGGSVFLVLVLVLLIWLRPGRPLTWPIGPSRPLSLNTAPHGSRGTLDILSDLVTDQAGQGVDALAGALVDIGRLSNLT